MNIFHFTRWTTGHQAFPPSLYLLSVCALDASNLLFMLVSPEYSTKIGFQTIFDLTNHLLIWFSLCTERMNTFRNEVENSFLVSNTQFIVKHLWPERNFKVLCTMKGSRVHTPKQFSLAEEFYMHIFKNFSFISGDKYHSINCNITFGKTFSDWDWQNWCGRFNAAQNQHSDLSADHNLGWSYGLHNFRKQ